MDRGRQIAERGGTVTKDDDTGDEAGEDEVLSGELVGEDDDAPALSRWGNVVAVASILLVLTGIVLFSLSVPRVVDPDSWVCTMSRVAVDDANDDDDAWNDVDLDGAESADDLSCDDAIALADSIPTSEDGDETLTVSSAGATRAFGIVAALLGLVQVVGGLGTAMTRSFVYRRVAITGAIVGLIAPVLGFLSLVIIAFVIWALLFSRTAKQIWGEIRFLGGSRRSPKA
jgi:hypothetical protein